MVAAMHGDKLLGQYVWIPAADTFAAVQAYFARDMETRERIWQVRLPCGCVAYALDGHIMPVGPASPELAARCVAGGRC